MPRRACPVCDLVFENTDLLQDHTAKTHPPEDHYHICHENFESSQALEDHLEDLSKHSVCEPCGRILSYNEEEKVIKINWKRQKGEV